ncbi:MAG: ATP-binding cassette domain-containing protein [Candidatus Aegiribacteria sp.]|nr:ATP-binding cassette domain-containing protein [Candidatus Aegiribacteria sp.]MBD3295687.1 ATP-binding cassette domain-containing protein [Candidatus Fermentibacteria bacterium]
MKSGPREEGFKKSSLKLLYRRILNHKKAIGAGIFTLLIVDAMQLLVPQVFERTIDGLASGMATDSFLLKMGLAILALYLVMGIFRFFWRYFVIGSSHRIDRNIRQELYDHLQTLSPQYYDQTKVGDIMAHATNDIKAVRMATGIATIASIDAIFLSLSSVTIMVLMNWQLTLITMIPLPIIAFMMLKFGKLIHKRFEAVQKAFSTLTEKAQESLSGVRVIKAYGDEETEEEYFSEKAEQCVIQNVKLARIWGLFQPMIGALAMASTAILLGVGGTMVVKGLISLGEFVAFSSYLMMLIWPMIAIGWVVNLLQRGAASMDRLQRIFNTQPDMEDGENDITPKPAVRVEDLTFRYPGTDVEVLKDVSFSIAEGETLGVVGRTGSGKTTLVELLMRLYDPPEDKVFIGGEEIHTLKLSEIRGLFGYVPQETFLFAMSIAENIAFGAGDISMERIRQLTRIVDIDSEIENFPDAYDTTVGERGVTLSGGQKQRVAIARALAVKPRILVLDDALSSVDTETEAAILSRLQEDISNLTSILIAHRISTIQNADNILVMDDGRIVEQGTHQELLQRDGFYAELYRMQQLEEEAKKEESSQDTEGGEV